MPSAALIITVGGSPLPASKFLTYGGDPTMQGWSVDHFWPEPLRPVAPEHLPKEVERVFLQGEQIFPTVGHEDAAGAMYRKALDIGLKEFDPTVKGLLGARIKALAAAGKLTPDLAEWADHVRDLGNEAVHDSPQPTREDTQALRGFTEMVLRYLFTLPGMVRARRGDTGA